MLLYSVTPDENPDYLSPHTMIKNKYLCTLGLHPETGSYIDMGKKFCGQPGWAECAFAPAIPGIS
jgi:hypothetical protein